jgi:hypothetical protein
MKTINVYQFNELQEDVKDDVIHYFKEEMDIEVDFSVVKEDFKNILSYMGIVLEKAYFSGFWSQGDGASFTGYFRLNGKANVKKYAPKDTELETIANSLNAIHKKEGPVYGYISQKGRYVHENTMSCVAYTTNINIQGKEFEDYAESTDELLKIFNDLARWYYRQLESHYENETSEKAIRGYLVDSEHTFTINGTLLDV